MSDDLLNRLERLRGMGLRKGPAGLARAPRVEARMAGRQRVEPAHESYVLPGEEIETPYGHAWMRTVRYPLAEHPELAQFLHSGPHALAALGRETRLATLQPQRAVFLDTETTGLSPGTDNYTFLIGIGTFEMDDGAGALVIRQFFMRHPGEERAQLHLVTEVLDGCGGMISFNGRAFDVPLVQNRFRLFRMPVTPLAVPHLDLLPPARRLWRARLISCSLSSLERNVLQVERTSDDVPGWMIPGIYRDFFQSGTGTELVARVFYHNLEDIRSMVLLSGRMAGLFEPDRLQDAIYDLHPLDCASLARCFGALDWVQAGEMAYRAALSAQLPDSERALIFRDFSQLLKRAQRRAEAAALWEEWISTVPGADVTPFVELAKYHEWHTGDLLAARGWTGWAIRTVDGWPPGFLRDDTLAQLRHRQERLERKLAGIVDASSTDAPNAGDDL